MTREEKIDRLVEQVDGWDLDTVMDYAKNNMRECLDALGDDQVNQEFIDAGFVDEDEEEETEECEECGWAVDECECEEEEKAEEPEDQSEHCTCSIDVIMKDGCLCGGN